MCVDVWLLLLEPRRKCLCRELRNTKKSYSTFFLKKNKCNKLIPNKHFCSFHLPVGKDSICCFLLEFNHNFTILITLVRMFLFPFFIFPCFCNHFGVKMHGHNVDQKVLLFTVFNIWFIFIVLFVCLFCEEMQCCRSVVGEWFFSLQYFRFFNLDIL